MKKQFKAYLLFTLIILSFISCEKEEEIAPNLKFPLRSIWEYEISSTPLLYSESNLKNDLAYNYNRARISWYSIDPIFYELSYYNQYPTDNSDNSIHYNRQIYQKETDYEFKDDSLIPGSTIFNIAYYPSERGPYNFDTSPSQYSAGLNSNGNLNDPSSRWAGIQRRVKYINKVNYIEFWLMDPFIDHPDLDGELNFNIGDISEEILQDGLMSWEGGLPAPNLINEVDTTVWGIIPKKMGTFHFSINPDDRPFQDIGLDGLNNDAEKEFFKFYHEFINQFTEITDNKIINDISADDYLYYLDDGFNQVHASITNRYRYYRNHENNSPFRPYGTESSTMPSCEDINHNYQLETSNDYFEYKVQINKSSFYTGRNYIIESKKSSIELPNGEMDEIRWYHFKIPIDKLTSSQLRYEYDQSTSFRIYLTGFENEVILRFTSFNLTSE